MAKKKKKNNQVLRPATQTKMLVIQKFTDVATYIGQFDLNCFSRNSTKITILSQCCEIYNLTITNWKLKRSLHMKSNWRLLLGLHVKSPRILGGHPKKNSETIELFHKKQKHPAIQL